MILRAILYFTFALAFSSVYGQFALDWESEYNGEGDFSDKFTCITTDANGNVYAAGSTISPSQSLNFLIVKYTSTGDEIWRKELNAPGNGPDQAKELVVLDNGNVYATGYGNGIGTGSDFYTVALNSTGDTLWTRLYNDPLYNQYDEAESLAIDDQGNIYVTGESDSDISGAQNDDYLLVKYDSDGTFQWASRYDGLGGQTDRAVRVVTFADNNVYVTGRSFNGNDDDFVTIKYDANGQVLWNKVIDNGGTDRATDMGIDDSGNIYVCGRRDNGNDDDYFIVKYSPSGTALFTKFFDYVGDDRAEAIAVGGDGSFAVTGRSDVNPTVAVNFDFYTLLYDANGTLLWSKSFGGTVNNDDWPGDVEINEQHSVAVCGYVDTDPNALTVSYDKVTLLYSADGTAQWTSQYDQSGFNDFGSGVILTESGEVISSGYLGYQTNNYNATLQFHGSDGTANTVAIEGKGDQTENIRDLILASDGSVYSCGYSVGMETDRNFFTMKHSAAGGILWSDTLSGNMFGSDDEANSLALDGQSNLFVSGYIKNSGTGSDVVIRKYNSAGAILWTVIYDGDTHEADRAYDIAADASGNVYITGRTDIDASLVNNDEIYTAKYSTDGVLLWNHAHQGSQTESDRGEFVRILPNGNILVVGRSNVGLDEDIELIAYNSVGALQWAATYNSGNGSDKPEDVVISATGEIFIAGSTQEQFGQPATDAVLLKYSSEGALLWINTYSGAANNSDVFSALTIDNEGNIYAGGSVDTDPGVEVNPDVNIMKFNTDGELLWQVTEDLSAGNEDLLDHLLFANDNVYALAHADSDASDDVNYDIHLFALSAEGTISNPTIYAASDSSDVGEILAFQGNSLYVGGSTWNSEEQRNALVLKYSVFSGVQNHLKEGPIVVYPNPASDLLVISAPDSKSWTITDLAGQVILMGKNCDTIIDIQSLVPGPYLINVVSENLIMTKKFIKL